MKIHITTIFDKNYLVRALAFRESLYRYAPEANVYMLCLDLETYTILEEMALEKTKIFKAEDLGDTELMEVKSVRTLPEFASTCKPAFLKHVFSLEVVSNDDLLAFIDPDILFYHNTEHVFNQIFNSGSITITPHRFPAQRDNEKYKKGTYNAGMIFFRKDNNTRICIEEWRKQCIDWCYIRYEDGKIGDQGYLTEWPKKYAGVFILENKGVNLGSWNIENYKIKYRNNEFLIDDEILICYHFHGLKIYLDNKNYVRILPVTILHEKIYEIYREKLDLAYKKIIALKYSWVYGFIKHPGFIRIIKQKIFKLLRL